MLFMAQTPVKSGWKQLCMTDTDFLPCVTSQAFCCTMNCPGVPWHMTSAFFRLIISVQNSAELAEKFTTHSMSYIACVSKEQQISQQQRTTPASGPLWAVILCRGRASLKHGPFLTGPYFLFPRARLCKSPNNPASIWRPTALHMSILGLLPASWTA